MCGIVGYIGSKQAYPILIKGLKRLEYRGYDSAGVGLISHEFKLNVYKAKGKVSNLEDTASQKDTSGHTGIAHTRWATHGEPCQANAHPHLSQSGNLALVHNGIIENYATLREQLQEKGYTFKSSTDTEVLVHEEILLRRREALGMSTLPINEDGTFQWTYPVYEYNTEELNNLLVSKEWTKNVEQ